MSTCAVIVNSTLSAAGRRHQPTKSPLSPITRFPPMRTRRRGGRNRVGSVDRPVRRTQMAHRPMHDGGADAGGIVVRRRCCCCRWSSASYYFDRRKQKKSIYISPVGNRSTPTRLVIIREVDDGDAQFRRRLAEAHGSPTGA